MRATATRRQLMAGGIAAAAAAAFTGAAAVAASPPAESDPQVLARVLGIELLVVTAYRQVLATKLLEPGVREQLEVLLRQELEHVATLRGALARMGATGPAAPNLPAAQAELTRHQVYWSLTHLRHQRSCLKLLVDVESLAENAYFKAIAGLRDPQLARTSAEAMGCEAQHWTVLSGLLHHDDVTKAVPYPFVGGSL
jgi:Ferritin-like domain